MADDRDAEDLGPADVVRPALDLDITQSFDEGRQAPSGVLDRQDAILGALHGQQRDADLGQVRTACQSAPTALIIPGPASRLPPPEPCSWPTRGLPPPSQLTLLFNYSGIEDRRTEPPVPDRV